jgi:two-component SAPR family response regulator
MPKTKELLALLVDRCGGYIDAPAAIACLWEDEPADKTTMARYRKTAMRLKETLDKNGIGDIIETVNGRRRIVTDRIECDLYQYMSGEEEYASLFTDAYMQNYSWGENTLARLAAIRRSRSELRKE